MRRTEWTAPREGARLGDIIMALESGPFLNLECYAKASKELKDLITIAERSGFCAKTNLLVNNDTSIPFDQTDLGRIEVCHAS